MESNMSVIQFIKENTAAKIAISCIVALFLILLILTPFSFFLFTLAFVTVISLFVGGFFAVMCSLEQYQEQKRWGGRK